MELLNRPLFTDESAERDAGCVAASLAGETKAFGRLVESYQKAAVSIAYRLLNNSDDAQEVVQNAFLKAYQSLGRLKDPCRFGPWFLRIVSNLSLNARRSRRSSLTLTWDEPQGTDGTTSRGEPMAATLGPDRQLEGRELQAALDAALKQLPDKQRLALLLFTVEGWPQKDIAKMLECSVEVVKWNVFQARKKLRVLLGDVLSEEG